MSPPNVHATDNPDFYDHHWEHADTSRDPHIVEKAKLLESMIPPDVRTIVDIGCGDGFITQQLAARWDVTGVDRSKVALSKLRCRAVEASADSLPFPDRSMDLLLSSQMLEHLPNDIYTNAIAEMARVASNWLLLSVPYREQIQRRVAQCVQCRLEFNINGHLRSFDEAVLDAAFPDFERLRTELAGPPEDPTYAALEHARQKMANRWYTWKGANITCPDCGNTRFDPRRRNGLHRLIDRGLTLATNFANFYNGRRPEPYWIIVLMRRRSM